MLLQFALVFWVADSFSNIPPLHAFPEQRHAARVKTKPGTAPHIIFRPSVALFNYLGTNLEWLAEERYQDPVYQKVDWVDPSIASTTTFDDEQDDLILDDVPIYPIPAVYLPYGNHTLHNTEPRNLKMALDLNETTSNKLFCVTLSAADTGRIATTGTLLQATELEPRYEYDDQGNTNLKRITVYCQSMGIVEICSVTDPVTLEQKVLRSSNYITGRVRRRPQSLATTNVTTDDNTIQQLQSQIQDDIR